GSVSAAPTCDTSWKVASSGDFNTAVNWTSGVPTSTKNACITIAGAGNYTVTLSGASATVKTLTLGAASGPTTQTLSVLGTGCGTAASLTTTTTGSTVKATGRLLATADNACSGN